MRSLYLTTPLYYASGPPHVGHAYTTILADAITRFERGMLGSDNVLLLTGTDENGRKIERAAEAAGKRPKDFVDHVSEGYRDAWAGLGVGPHGFVRTTYVAHADLVRQAWEALASAGDIYLGEYEGLYCEGCEAFVTEKDLREGLCPDHGRRPEAVREKSYFFRLSRYRDRLLQMYKERPDFVRPSSRFTEVRQRVEQGLPDLSISRTCRWGIQVPGDPEQTIYVWFDALLGYLSGAKLGRLAGRPGAWGDPGTRTTHLVGKEIVWFHAVYWPAFLMALGLDAPHEIVSHGWWTVEGEKMSKSRENVVDPVALGRRIGADALRYFLLREVPLGEDGDFSQRRLLSRYNHELCNDLGNLLNRTLTMVEKFSGGVLRQGFADSELVDLVMREGSRYLDAMKGWQMSVALDVVFAMIRAGNVYLEEKAPFRTHKTNPDLAACQLYNVAELLRHVGVFLEPFMPERSREILRQLGLDPVSQLLVWGLLPDGTKVRRGDVLFPRLTEEQLAEAWSAST